MIMEFSIVMGIPRVAGWFLSENPILKWDDHWGYPQFFRTSPHQKSDENPISFTHEKTLSFTQKLVCPTVMAPEIYELGKYEQKIIDFSTHEKSGYIIHIHISSYH